MFSCETKIICYCYAIVFDVSKGVLVLLREYGGLGLSMNLNEFVNNIYLEGTNIVKD